MTCRLLTLIFIGFMASNSWGAEIPTPESSEAVSTAPSTDPKFDVRVSPMGWFYGAYGGDLHYSVLPSFDLGVSVDWFRTTRGIAGTSSTNVWQIGPSVIFYPFHTHDTDGPYLHATALYMPITNSSTRTTTHFRNWTTGLLAGYSWINRWKMIFNLGAGLAYYHDDPAYKTSSFGTLGNNNDRSGVQVASEFTLGFIF